MKLFWIREKRVKEIKSRCEGQNLLIRTAEQPFFKYWTCEQIFAYIDTQKDIFFYLTCVLPPNSWIHSLLVTFEGNIRFFNPYLLHHGYINLILCLSSGQRQAVWVQMVSKSATKRKDEMTPTGWWEWTQLKKMGQRAKQKQSKKNRQKKKSIEQILTRHEAEVDCGFTLPLSYCNRNDITATVRSSQLVIKQNQIYTDASSWLTKSTPEHQWLKRQFDVGILNACDYWHQVAVSWAKTAFNSRLTIKRKQDKTFQQETLQDQKSYLISNLYLSLSGKHFVIIVSGNCCQLFNYPCVTSH